MTITLRVHGLDCADEAAELREALQSRPGVRELSFDVLRGLMIVEHDETVITRDDLIAAGKFDMRVYQNESPPTSPHLPVAGGLPVVRPRRRMGGAR